MALNLGEASIFARVDLSRLGTDIARAREVALAGFSGIGGALAAAGGVLGGLHLGRMLGGFADAAAMAEEGTARLTMMFNNNRGAAGQTQEQINQLTQELATMARVALPTAQEAMVQFLTRTEIRGTQFERAVKMLPDIAAFFKTDLVTATNYWSRALEQPGRAMRYLSQRGVPFTQAQINALNMLVKAGPEGITRAQDLTANVMEAHVSGMAKARAATFAGQREITGAFITGTRIAIGEALIPAFTAINDLLMHVASEIKGGMPAFTNVANSFAQSLAMIGDWVKRLIAWFQSLPEPVTRAVGQLAMMAAVFVPLLGILPRLIMLFGALTGAGRVLLGPVGILSLAFVAMGGTFEDLIGYAGGLADVVGAVVDGFRRADKATGGILGKLAVLTAVALVLAPATTMVSNAVYAVSAALYSLIAAISLGKFTNFSVLMFNVGTVFKNTYAILYSLTGLAFTPLGAGLLLVAGALAAVTGGFTDMDAVLGPLRSSWDALAAGISAVAGYIRGLVGRLGEWYAENQGVINTVLVLASGAALGLLAYQISMIAGAMIFATTVTFTWAGALKLLIAVGHAAQFAIAKLRQGMIVFATSPVALAFMAVGAAIGYVALETSRAHREAQRLVGVYDELIKKAQQASQEQSKRAFLESQTGLGRVRTLLAIADEVKKAEGGDGGAEDRIAALQKRLRAEAPARVPIAPGFEKNIDKDIDTVNNWRRAIWAGASKKPLIDEKLITGELKRPDELQKVLKMPIQDAQDYETFLKLATKELERQQAYYKNLGDVGAGLTADAQKMTAVGALTSKEQNEVYAAQARLGSNLTVVSSREGMRVAKQLADLRRVRGEMGDLTEEGKKTPPPRQEQLLEKVRITGIVEFAKYIQTSLERSFDAEREARNADNLKKTADGIDDMKKDTKRIADKLERGADDLGLRAEE